MKRVLLLGLLASGCTELAAPFVEQNTNEVRVEPEPKVVFPQPPGAAPAVAEPVRLERVLPQTAKVKLVYLPSLTTEPPEVTRVTELREVTLGVELQGFDPSELAVEFIAPEGNIYERQTRRLTHKRTVHQYEQFTLPVSGTTIATNKLVGTWHAHVFHEGVELSRLSFEVTP